jgi:hypothetical protein
MSNLTLSQYIAMPAGEGERISFNGLDIVFKSTARQENGWTVLEYTLPARQFGAPYHYHKELTESFYIVEGEAWFRLGDEEYNLGAGSFSSRREPCTPSPTAAIVRFASWRTPPTARTKRSSRSSSPWC